MNEIKPGSGDKALSDRMAKRLHLDMADGKDQGGIPNDPLLEALLGQAGGPQSGPPMGPEQIAMNGGEQMPPMPGMPPGGPGMPPGMPPGGPPMPGMPPM